LATSNRACTVRVFALTCGQDFLQLAVEGLRSIGLK
jgi:hypothetical protein